MLDVLFITPNSAKTNYQSLSKKYSAVETPTWSLLLAESCRSIGKKVAILDCQAENLCDVSVIKRLENIKTRLICFVVYGQNVNAGSTNMLGAVRLSSEIKKKIQCMIGFIGSHVQALPEETLKNEESIDFIFYNEGVYALRNILNQKVINSQSLSKIKGIAYKDSNRNIIFNEGEKIVPNEKMDIDLPGYAWDLLPFKNKPLDLYRSPMWHAEYDNDNRSPYAAIQTSIGCQFQCNFCMINIVNKNDNKKSGISSSYNKMRFWSTKFIIKEFDKLIKLGVKTIKITDEMFLLNKKFYLPLCELLAERNKNDDLKIWAYSRIDTIKNPDILSVVRKAGIKWLCLGIESADKKIRLEVSKGKFEDVDVKKIVKQIEASDINVMANYIYGLPGDTAESINKTYELSKDLCTLGWNTYAATALPGSPLYMKAKLDGIKIPKKYEEFSFHSYETIPLSTKYLKASQVLQLRDKKFTEYHKYDNFLQKVKKKFGIDAMNNIVEMNKVKLKRKIIDEESL